MRNTKEGRQQAWEALVIVIDGKEEKGEKQIKEYEGREGEGGGERERRIRKKGGRYK